VELEVGVVEELGASQSVWSTRAGVGGRRKVSPALDVEDDSGDVCRKVLLKVLRMVGEMAERVSSRRLVDPLP
jgi:hypothetical protein